jgi:hypothetical protein
MKRTGTTQRAAIKKFLEDGFSLTALEALSLFGAYRLAAHIEVLRNKHGMPIVTHMCVDVTGRTYARYSLPSLTTYPAYLNDASRQMEIAYHA